MPSSHDTRSSVASRRALPEGYSAPAGCVVAAGDHVYLADDRGAVVSLTPDGQTIETRSLPEPASSISISPDKTRIYVLSITHLFAIDTRSGRFTSSPLAAPSGGIAALATGRVVVGNRLSSRLDVYCPDGSLCGQVGGSGDWPGQVQEVEGMATNAGSQQLYVADSVNRVVNRFTADGHLTALYWSVEDEEQGEVKR
ncbi:MAG TPA: hypothetical protein VF807_13470 [Ktedonobacterales bacterium]